MNWEKFKEKIKQFWQSLFKSSQEDKWAKKQILEMAKLGGRLVL
jgi:hypothetical protein